VPSQAREDIGRTAYGVFRTGPALIGETVSVAGSVLTGQQYAQAFGTALGEPVTYRSISAEAIRAAGLPGADARANMQAYFVAAEEDIVQPDRR
jgi:hypothetical protein